MKLSMSEGKKEFLEGSYSDIKEKDEWVVNNPCASSSSSSSMEDSTISDVSSASLSSLETTDDASSSSSSAQDSINGSLYDLSDLMTQLPIKRGLSKFYHGKSESFTCLSRVTSVEDLVKKESPYKRRKILKGCKSYGGGLDNYKSYTLPKPIISKKSFKGGSFSYSSFPSRNGSFTSSLRPPLIPSQKNLAVFK